ncbi:MAG TPA: M20 family metallopeptidase [Bryobacteraceae bacterium]|nr:M20 family metallopeptidase [Bryobacteraceae bacterium]
MHSYLHWANAKQKDIIGLIQEMVECESPSGSPEKINRIVDLLVARTSDIAHADFVESEEFGKHLRLTFNLGQNSQGQILALGHSDTVWPVGTLKNIPFRETDGRLWGPGVLDMKSGLAFLVYAVRALKELAVIPRKKIVLLVVADEEVGSRSSRPLTEAEAGRSDYVLVLEPGTGLSGKLKTSRKGVGLYNVRVTGKSVHAGIDFAAGASAIVEAAHQILNVAEFTDLRRGVTVNPGIVSGGTRTNVVAADAQIAVDTRVVRLRDAEALDRKFHSLRAADKRCCIEVSGGLNRPPMERTKEIQKLFNKAKSLGRGLGLKLEESATGGGSDGNFTAALGVPTLDGLGGVGEGAHANNESILIDRIADRTALLTSLLASL